MCEKHVKEFATHYCVDCTVFNCESCHLGKIAKTDSDPKVRLIGLVCVVCGCGWVVVCAVVVLCFFVLTSVWCVQLHGYVLLGACSFEWTQW